VVQVVLTIKIGDRVIESILSTRALQDLKAVVAESPTILVHGGGGTVTRIAERLGVQQRFVMSPEGFRSRFTDEETIQVYTMVMAGKINKQIVQRLQQEGIAAVGLSGLDGGLIRAERKKRIIVCDEGGRKRVIDGGYTGKIVGVNIDLLRNLLGAGYVPVIAPIALSEEFQPLNIDGDRTAAHIAGAIHARLLVLLTDVDGLSLEGELVSTLKAGEAKEFLPKIGPGMITKTYAALEAVSMGVECVKIGKGTIPTPFSAALTDEFGTRILP
jgi:[amino group carrier protein]-L-2-aminoadipate/L-glutamate 6-kinase